MTRPILKSAAVSAEALASMSRFHPEVLRTVSDAIGKHPVVVIGMAMNPFVKKARVALNKGGIEYKYLEFGGYASQWKERLAIKLWSGFPTFPQVFVDGTLIGGADEAVQLISRGSLRGKSSTGK